MCGKKITVYVAKGYGSKQITVRCGNTSPYGTPWLCEDCEAEHEGRNWRQEAEDAGERWDPLD